LLSLTILCATFTTALDCPGETVLPRSADLTASCFPHSVKVQSLMRVGRRASVLRAHLLRSPLTPFGAVHVTSTVCVCETKFSEIKWTTPSTGELTESDGECAYRLGLKLPRRKKSGICLCLRHDIIKGEWRYSSTHSKSRH
jgi:hypothetical protein